MFYTQVPTYPANTSGVDLLVNTTITSDHHVISCHLLSPIVTYCHLMTSHGISWHLMASHGISWHLMPSYVISFVDMCGVEGKCRTL